MWAEEGCMVWRDVQVAWRGDVQEAWRSGGVTFRWRDVQVV